VGEWWERVLCVPRYRGKGVEEHWLFNQTRDLICSEDCRNPSSTPAVPGKAAQQAEQEVGKFADNNFIHCTHRTYHTHCTHPPRPLKLLHTNHTHSDPTALTARTGPMELLLLQHSRNRTAYINTGNLGTYRVCSNSVQ
jgi:hypothetical protein